jgi:hypothetical protein
MTRLHLLRNLRTLVYLVVLGGLLAGAGFVVWANHTGLPAMWRTGIEGELAKHGIHARIGSLSLNLIRGLVAKDVTLYTDPERTREFCRLERLLVNVDKTKIARGKMNLTKIEITKAKLSLRIEPVTGPAETLEIDGLSGTLLMPGGRLIELRNTRANVAGFNVTLGARLLKFRPTGQPPTEDTGKEARLLLITHILRELRDWRFARDTPPTLRCFIEGDLSDWSTLVARVALKAREVEKNGHLIDQVTADGTLSGSLLSLTAVQATDRRGTFNGRVDYDVHGREGRFDMRSSVNLPRLLQSWVGVSMLEAVSFGGSQVIETEGTFGLRPDGPPLVRLTGRARCGDLRIKGVPFETAVGSFAWQDDQLYLRDLVLKRPDGEASGKLMIQWPQVRMALRTTLPVPVYRPIFKDQPLEQVLNDFGELPGAKVDVSLEGGFDATDHRSWAFTGHGRMENVTFRGVPADLAECDLALSHEELDFTKGTAVFNFRDYPQRKAHGGPPSGTLKVGRVRFDGPSKMVEVVDVAGTAWAAPVVRTFAPEVADMLEIYRFRQPPALKASGVVDVTPQNRTALTVSFNTRDAADYVLLGKNVTLERPSGTVGIRGPKVTVSDLEADVFGGPVKVLITVAPENRVSCEASWTELSLQAVSDTYGFNLNGGGLLTGRAELQFTEGRINTLAGRGLTALEGSVLFSAPVLGPLSGLVSTVLNDKRAGFERARDAYLTFTIADGILHTKDFHTSTPSLVFAADGAVDFNRLTIDANVRVNARGLLGVVTFPLRPFSGLFQFRGTGPLGKPEWVKAPVTPPPPEQEGALLQPPRARIIDAVPGAVPRRNR